MQDYFEKIERLETDLSWNIPERKMGRVNVVGGNSQKFRAEVKISEFIAGKYPLEEVKTVLPDALRGQLPDLPNFVFLKSTESGSLADAEALVATMDVGDYNLVLGEFSKNTITMKVVAEALAEVKKPILVTRDAVDLMAEAGAERILMNPEVVIFASMPQMIKLLRSVYYPKMVTLTQPLMQVVEVLHKFTLSYPVKIITLNSGQILLAENGEVRAVELAKSGYMPMMVWNGELAAKITALNLYNPGKFLEATLNAILG